LVKNNRLQRSQGGGKSQKNPKKKEKEGLLYYPFNFMERGISSREIIKPVKGKVK